MAHTLMESTGMFFNRQRNVGATGRIFRQCPAGLCREAVGIHGIHREGIQKPCRHNPALGLQDRYLHDFTFVNDNGQNPLMEKAHAYVGNWKEAYRENIGLLLFGDIGTGKSFFAGCIANALIDQDIPVLMTNIPAVLNRLTGMFAEDRAAFISALDFIDILFVLLEPLALALADDEVNGKLNFDFMTKPIDCNYFERCLNIWQHRKAKK